MGSLKIIFWIVVGLVAALMGLRSYSYSIAAEREGVVHVQRQPGWVKPLLSESPYAAGPQRIPFGPVIGNGLSSAPVFASAPKAQGFYFERVVVSPVGMIPPEQVVVGDVTGDGRSDIVVTLNDWGDEVLRIHAQNQDGTLAAPLEFRMPILSTSGGQGGGVELTDLDGDGLSEIVVGLGNGLAVFRKASGGYTSKSYGGGRVIALSLGAIDIDGDGYRDIFAQGWDNGADIYLSNRRGGFDSVDSLSTPLAGYNTLEISDFTADGIADVVMTNGQGWPMVMVYPTLSSGGFLDPIQIALPSIQTRPAFGMTVADIDRDGRPDLVVSDQGNALTPLRGIHIYYRGNGNEIGRHQFLQFTDEYQRPGAVQVADVDGNGYPDIVAMMNSNNQMAYILQGPTGFGIPVLQATSDNPWTNSFYLDNSFVIADVNSDACPDVVLAETSSSLRVFYGRNCQLPTRHVGGPLAPRRR